MTLEGVLTDKRHSPNKVGGVVGASSGSRRRLDRPEPSVVGQTGTTVKPEMYLAWKHMGAIQHQAGMSGLEDSDSHKQRTLSALCDEDCRLRHRGRP